ncbi:hypothetical protein Hanom_Chr12g01102701 [Helianthus anomalus]
MNHSSKCEHDIDYSHLPLPLVLFLIVSIEELHFLVLVRPIFSFHHVVVKVLLKNLQPHYPGLSFPPVSLS